jgi:mRNA interferase RelE/StbE
MSKIIFTERAARDFKKLNIDQQKRIGSKLLEYSNDPLTSAKKLSNPVLGTFRYRIGEHRIIFDYIDDEIIVLRVGHRKDIYK